MTKWREECPICGSSMKRTHSMLVLGRHEVDYSMCGGCDFWATAEPWWLDEAYTSAISSMDTGIARRTLQCHRVLFPLLTREFGTEAPFVDWASGPGLLVRLMRDSGLDYYWQDAYSANPFAAGFEWDFSKGPAAAVSAIEVFEHVVDPVAFVEEILVATGTDTILFTQELHHGPDPEWWYLVPETGQHIAFYSERTLAALAERVGMTVRSAGWIHMLTRRDVSKARFEREVRLAPYRFPVLERFAKGFTDSDSLLIAERLRARGTE